MDERERQRQLARNAKTVQNLQWMLIAGTVVGLVVGILVAAYVVLPAVGGSFLGVIVALAVVVGGALLGQRVVLALLAR